MTETLMYITHSTSTSTTTTLVTTTSVINTRHANQHNHVTDQANLEEAQKLAMLAQLCPNLHVDAHKDLMLLHGNVLNVHLVKEMTEIQIHTMHLISTSTTTTLATITSVCTKLVLMHHHVTLQDNLELDQKPAMPVNNDQKNYVDVLNFSTHKPGDVKNVVSDKLMTKIHKETDQEINGNPPLMDNTRHAHQLHHVTLQANFQVVQKLAMHVSKEHYQFAVVPRDMTNDHGHASHAQIDTFLQYQTKEDNASHKHAQDKTSLLDQEKLAMNVLHAHQDMLLIHSKKDARESQINAPVLKDTTHWTDTFVKNAHTGKSDPQTSNNVLTDHAH